MQHQNKTKEFGRKAGQRKALFQTMLGSFIMEEKIKTTEAKAKEMKKRIDRIINKAKKAEQGKNKKVTAIRVLRKELPATAVKKITGDFLKKFEKRKSGYSRVIKLAPRKSDGAKMAIVELITE